MASQDPERPHRSVRRWFRECREDVKGIAHEFKEGVKDWGRNVFSSRPSSSLGHRPGSPLSGAGISGPSSSTSNLARTQSLPPDVRVAAGQIDHTIEVASSQPTSQDIARQPVADPSDITDPTSSHRTLRRSNHRWWPFRSQPPSRSSSPCPPILHNETHEPSEGVHGARSSNTFSGSPTPFAGSANGEDGVTAASRPQTSKKTRVNGANARRARASKVAGGLWPGTTTTRATPSSGVKDVAKLSLNFSQMLLKKLPDVASGNPVTIALGLAKAVIEIKEAVKDNMDTTERRIVSTAALLEVLKDAGVDDWEADNEGKKWLEIFNSVLLKEWDKLCELRDESLIRKVADHEHEKSQVAESFERINEARIQFELYANIRGLRASRKAEVAAMASILNRLKPSHMADHRYSPEGNKREALYRAPCTPGTRVHIVKEITKWANDPKAHDIFYLHGPAGYGKSTIACTIARRFESALDPDDTIILGGNFFCSRQFEKTREEGRIIRTIVYQLAHKCDGFADALCSVKDIDSIIHQSVTIQIQRLLIDPWQRYRAACSKPPTEIARFLFLFDALDEVEMGGSTFLRDLLTIIRKNPSLGLRFFVTSRSDPDLVKRLDSFDRKQLLRLQDVETEVVQGDIATYLGVSLPRLAGSREFDGLKEFAGELFICAATAVRHLTAKKASTDQQKRLLQRWLALRAQVPGKDSPTAVLDRLYLQILQDAFENIHEEFAGDYLKTLHALLCTTERTSTSTLAKLLDSGGSPDVANDLINRLHAVLYVSNDNSQRILTYHKSFTDFIFDHTRSGDEFWCERAPLHELLTKQCFRIMNDGVYGLRFNIANIPSSFVLDSGDMSKNIPLELSYACRSWSLHLDATTSTPSHPLFKTLSKFLDLRVLFWIEAMNLLKCAKHCEADLRRASTWTREHDPDIARLTKEASTFALYFSLNRASKSTPHLYISSLATWPRNRALSGTWKKHFPRLPDFRTREKGGALCLTEINAEGDIDTIALSWNEEMIAAGYYDGSVRIWDARTGEKVLELQELEEARLTRKRMLNYGGPVAMTSVVFSPDDTHIVCGYGGKVRMCGVRSGEQLLVLEGHEGRVTSIAVSADGTYIASGSIEGTVITWDVHTKARTQVSLRSHRGPVLAVAISPNNRTICGAARTALKVWDMQGTQVSELAFGHWRNATSIAFSRDTSHFVISSDDGSVGFWDTWKGEQVSILPGDTSQRPRPYGAGPVSFAFSSGTTRNVYAVLGGSIKVWDVEKDEVTVLVQPFGVGQTHIVVSADGSRVISGSWCTLRIWDAQIEVKEKQVSDNGEDRYSGTAKGASDGCRFIPFGDGKVWDVQTREVSKLEGDGGSAANPGCTHYQTETSNKSFSVTISDVRTNERVSVLNGHKGAVTASVFSPDCARIVTGSRDKSVRIWDVRSGQQLFVLEGHTESVNTLAISADGHYIASGSYDESIRVWDGRTGKQLSILLTHDDVTEVNISDDGAFITSAGCWDEYRLWDLQASLPHDTPLAPGSVLSSMVSARGAHPRPMPYITERQEDGEPTGWLLSYYNHADRLMFVPTTFNLPMSPCIATYSTWGGLSTSVRFDDAALGEEWEKCYRYNPPAETS